jgi:hypothetical protein
MILRALAHNSEDRIAEALNVNVSVIRKKRALLHGVCDEAVEILKDRRATAKAYGIDEKGRPLVRASATPTPAGTKACPNVVGATNWYSTAYNPPTGLFYVMALESCGIYTKSDAWWEQGKSFYGGGTRRVPGETPERFLRALDIQTGKTVWEIPQIGGGGGWGGSRSFTITVASQSPARDWAILRGAKISTVAMRDFMTTISIRTVAYWCFL